MKRALAQVHAETLVARIAAILASCLFLSLTCEASVSVCEQPEDYSFVSLDFVNYARTSIDGGSGRANPLAQNVDLMFAFESKDFYSGFGHRYTIFDFDGIEPQTNAHLHTSFVPLHWMFEGDRRNSRLSVAFALSGSSNVMKDPRNYKSETLQLLMAWVTETPLSRQLSVGYGICGDHRFGEYTLYPVAGITWQPNSDLELKLGFPSSHLRFEITEQVTSVLRIAPAGNEWHVMERTLEAESRFVYESIALEWINRWQIRPRLALTVSLGRQFHNRYEMTLQNGQRAHLSGDPATRLGAGIRWRF